jgi:hypothetical protein
MCGKVGYLYIIIIIIIIIIYFADKFKNTELIYFYLYVGGSRFKFL